MSDNKINVDEIFQNAAVHVVTDRQKRLEITEWNRKVIEGAFPGFFDVLTKLSASAPQFKWEVSHEIGIIRTNIPSPGDIMHDTPSPKGARIYVNTSYDVPYIEVNGEGCWGKNREERIQDAVAKLSYLIHDRGMAPVPAATMLAQTAVSTPTV